MNKAITLLLSGLITTSALADDSKITPRIAWYGTLESGLAEAKRSGRPILLVSAAPHCTGVSGIW